MGIKKNKSNQKNYVQMEQNIWPIERDVMFRPARMKYVRKIIKPQGCVFCPEFTKKNKKQDLCVYKSKFSQIIVNMYPYNSGHLLILPLRHCGDLLQLSSQEYDDLHATLRNAILAVQCLYSPHGFNLGLNHGATGGAGIPDHLHYHIVPRWNGDLNFFPLIADTKLVVEDAKETYKKFKKYFDKLKKNKELT